MGKFATYLRRGGSPGTGPLEDYLARVAAAGGSMDATGISAVNWLIQRLMLNGLWSPLLEIWPCCGTNLAAALVKLKVWPGAPGSYTNVGFVSGDYVQTGILGGLTNTAGTAYLTGGPTNADLGTDCSLSVKARGISSLTGNRFFTGTRNATDQWWLGAVDPSTSDEGRAGGTVTAGWAQAMTAGFRTISRTSTTALAYFHTGVLRGTNATLVAPATTADRAAIFASNNAGAYVGIMTCILTGAAFGRGLSAPQAAALASIWAEYDAMLSR